MPASKSRAFAAQSADKPLAAHGIERREPRPTDVDIEILFCGVCHTDIHFARNEWGMTLYPCVPGHEIVGRITRVGSAVKSFKAGDAVGVGCLVDSCRDCPNCRENLEQYCIKGSTFTYNAPDIHSGGHTFGGYSDRIVCDEKFVLKVPTNLDLAGAAPLLCAGITTYSPLRHWKVGKGSKVGVVGLGGLGHMGLKLAHAMGAHVTLFTTSPGKSEDAKRLGADDVIISTDKDAMAHHGGAFEFILDTLAVPHSLDDYTHMLRRDGTLCLVGAPAAPHPSPAVFNLLFGRKAIAGSLIGGIKETQEMLDFCGRHNIVSDIERIPIQKINEAYDRMMKRDVKYRFVIDMASLKN